MFIYIYIYIYIDRREALSDCSADLIKYQRIVVLVFQVVFLRPVMVCQHRKNQCFRFSRRCHSPADSPPAVKCIVRIQRAQLPRIQASSPVQNSHLRYGAREESSGMTAVSNLSGPAHQGLFLIED